MNVNNGGNNQTILGTAVGAGVGYGAYKASNFALNIPRSAVVVASLMTTPQYGDEYVKVANDIIKNKKLPIKIVSPDVLPPELKLKPKSLYQKFLYKIYNVKGNYKRSLKATKEGFNAFFRSANKVICLNKEQLASPVFHELGHAINFYKNGFWRKVQKIKSPAKIAPLALLGTALLTPKKSREAKEKQGIVGKTTTFIKENVGKLSMLAMLPVLAEEIKASQIGNKLAKKHLTGDSLKSVLKTNKTSMFAYAGFIAITGAAVSIANKVRDKVAALVDKKSK